MIYWARFQLIIQQIIIHKDILFPSRFFRTLLVIFFYFRWSSFDRPIANGRPIDRQIEISKCII